MQAATAQVRKDPYEYHLEDVTSPPEGLGQILRRIGPGMILAASIVGSGELIATTTLGAQVGYAAMWIMIFSCVVKPVVQAELGPLHHRHRRDQSGGFQFGSGAPVEGELDRVGLGDYDQHDPVADRRACLAVSHR